MPSKVEAGYFQLQSDFCKMGQEYLLGVEFGESITDLEYSSSEGFQASVSHNQMQDSRAGSDAAWRSDVLRIMQLPDYHQDQCNVGSSGLTDIPGFHEHSHLARDQPSVFPQLQIDKFHDSSNCSFEGTLPDENGGSTSPLGEMFCHPRSEENAELGPMHEEGKTNIFDGHEATMSAKAGYNEVLTHKRSRKPTKRYIDEFADPVSTSKKRQVVSSSLKDNAFGLKDHKKCSMGSRTTMVPADESSMRAIQVPFGSLVNNECSEENARNTDMDTRNLMTSTENQKRRDECITAVHVKIIDESPTSQKRGGARVNVGRKGRRDYCIIAASKKRNGHIIDVNSKKRNDSIAAMRQTKQLDCLADTNQKKTESYEEVSGRRKHHVLWTITEVRKLVDGVSRYGVGRWSQIKKLFFAASTHRTSVDLKDKWRNLLKASGIPQQGSRQGEKKRSVPWRPLPKSILRRVCELATRHPYPKLAHFDHDAPDASTDMTLSDYRRILRSISGN